MALEKDPKLERNQIESPRMSLVEALRTKCGGTARTSSIAAPATWNPTPVYGVLDRPALGWAASEIVRATKRRRVDV